MFVAVFDTSEVDAALDRLEAAIDAEMEGVVARAGDAVAREARTAHEFHNRSHELEGAIAGVEPGGSYLAGTLAGGAVGATDYGAYVEARKPFLAPAWQVVSPYVEQDTDYALARAARTAGWV